MDNFLDNKEKIYCPVRSTWVLSQPEEILRQRLLRYMIEDLGYPKGLLVVERELDSIPGLELAGSFPNRRIDILACRHETEEGGGGKLSPLVLIECKAGDLKKKGELQLIGYNYYVQAPFIALVNEQEVKFGRYDSLSGEYLFSNQFLSYSEACGLQ